MKCRFQKIESEHLGLHNRLLPDDDCYFLGEYTARQGFDYSEINQLIHNIKKEPSRKERYEYRYKERDINTIIQCFQQLINTDYLESIGVLVPIPPSKIKTDPEYDDRMSRICLGVTSVVPGGVTAELIRQNESMEADHLSGNRLSVEELKSIYEIDITLAKGRKHFILIDDVLTVGTHFRACKDTILERIPDAEVIGVFIARCVFPDPVADFSGLVI